MIKIEIKPIKNGEKVVGIVKTLRFFGIKIATKKVYNVSLSDDELWFPTI